MPRLYCALPPASAGSGAARRTFQGGFCVVMMRCTGTAPSSKWFRFSAFEKRYTNFWASNASSALGVVYVVLGSNDPSANTSCASCTPDLNWFVSQSLVHLPALLMPQLLGAP